MYSFIKDMAKLMLFSSFLRPSIEFKLKLIDLLNKHQNFANCENEAQIYNTAKTL